MIICRGILRSSERTYIDQTINVCTWINNRKASFVISFFKQFLEKHVNPDLLKCPVKKGKYLLLDSRKKPASSDDFGGLPLFVPAKGLFNFTISFKTKIRKQTKLVFKWSQNFELF